MVHGLVDDYLYSGWWAALVFFPVGMSMLAVGTEIVPEPVSTRAVSLAQGGSKVSFRSILLVVFALVTAVVGLNWNRVAALWFANLGAVEMGKVELAGYPANQWDDGGRIDRLQSAKFY